MSAPGTGSWEAARPRLAGFLGLLERWVARVPTAWRAATSPPTSAPAVEPLPLGIIEGAAGERVVVALLDDLPTSFGPAGHGKDATT